MSDHAQQSTFKTLVQPFDIYHNEVEIGDANGHVCTAENPEIAKDIVKALELAVRSPAATGDLRKVIEEAAKYLDDVEGGMLPCKVDTPSQIAEKLRQAVRSQSQPASAVEEAFVDICRDLGCEPDNEAALMAIKHLRDQVEQAAGIVLEPVSIPRQVFWCNGQKCQSGDGDTEFVTVREVEAAFRAKAEKIRASIASTDGAST